MREPLTDWNREWVACAEEAAGKARNELLPEWFNQFLTNVCELPDRNSPDDEPEAVVATLEELRNCAIDAIEQCAAPTPIVATDAAAPTCMCSGLGPCEQRTDGLCRLKMAAPPDERAAMPQAGALTVEQWEAIAFAYTLLDEPRTENGKRYVSVLRTLLATYPTEQRMSDAARDVLAERARQVSEEGWTPAHDDEHASAALAAAAACYALLAAADVSDSADAWLQEWRKIALAIWPFDIERLKPSSPRCNYVKAGAMILAEIERIDRDPGDESIHHHAHGGDL